MLDEERQISDVAGHSEGCVRIFVGWDLPMLGSVAGWLMGEGQRIGLESGLVEGLVDLSGTTVLVPGARSGRLLVSALTELRGRGVGDGDGMGGVGGMGSGGVIPPEVLTPGVWVERGTVGFCDVGGERLAAASAVARRWAWIEAVRSAPEAERVGVLGSLLPSGSFDDAWMRIGSYLERVSDVCAGGGYRFGDVAAIAGGGVDAGEIERWVSAAALQDRYEDVLERDGLFDPALRVARVVSGGGDGRIAGLGRCGRVVLAGVSELTRTQRMALRRCVEAGVEVVSLICAPEAECGGFDEFGAVRAEVWGGRDVRVDAGDVWFADGPRSQGEAVVSGLLRLLGSEGGLVDVAESDGGLTSDDVVVGIADPSLIGNVERCAGRAGLGVRPSVGRAFGLSGPAVFLTAACAYAGRPTLEAFAGLVRHPALAAYARRLAGAGDVRVRGLAEAWRWAEIVDAYSEGVGVGSIRLHDRRLMPLDVRGAGAFVRLRRFVHGMLGPMLARAGDGCGERRSAGAWAEAMAGVLGEVFAVAEGEGVDDDGGGVGGGGDLAGDPETVEAMVCFEQALASLAGLPASAGEMRLSRAVSLLMAGVPGALAPARDGGCGDEIEAVGWLELMFDPARLCVIAGFHDHVVPGVGGGVAGGDGLLTERWRERLGIGGSSGRAARDAYLLRMLVSSRSRVLFVVGRRDGAGDRVWPSRLLFRDDAGIVVERLGRFLGGEEKGGDGVDVVEGGSGLVVDGESVGAGFGGRGLTVWPAGVPTSMSVSSFRSYLASPYLFYLESVLRLRVFESAGRELDAGVFGGLVHEALRVFAGSRAASSDDSRLISESLHEALEDEARRLVGSRPTAAVRMQLDMAHRRLGYVAAWQAAHSREGWRIEHAEWSPSVACGLDVDGEVMLLRGRIDRIDRNEITGEVCLIDYKTGRGADKPTTAHRRRDGTWVDLQLPLYRHLAASVVGGAGVRLAYLEVPTKEPKKAWKGSGLLHVADWTDEDLSDADETAFEVVRAVRRGEFAELGDAEHASGALAALCGVWYPKAGGEDGWDADGGGDGVGVM